MFVLPCGDALLTRLVEQPLLGIGGLLTAKGISSLPLTALPPSCRLIAHGLLPESVAEAGMAI